MWRPPFSTPWSSKVAVGNSLCIIYDAASQVSPPRPRGPHGVALLRRGAIQCQRLRRQHRSTIRHDFSQRLHELAGAHAAVAVPWPWWCRSFINWKSIYIYIMIIMGNYNNNNDNNLYLLIIIMIMMIIIIMGNYLWICNIIIDIDNYR